MLDSIRYIDEWVKEISPDIICFTKCDIEKNKLNRNQTSYITSKNTDVLKYNISSKSNYNISHPILFIIRKFFNDDKAHFIPL